jgi:hypothetical protein
MPSAMLRGSALAGHAVALLLACRPIHKPLDLLQQQVRVGSGEEQLGVVLVDLMERDKVRAQRVGDL